MYGVQTPVVHRDRVGSTRYGTARQETLFFATLPPEIGPRGKKEFVSATFELYQYSL
jgi:hypothetical protein